MRGDAMPRSCRAALHRSAAQLNRICVGCHLDMYSPQAQPGFGRVTVQLCKQPLSSLAPLTGMMPLLHTA